MINREPHCHNGGRSKEKCAASGAAQEELGGWKVFRRSIKQKEAQCVCVCVCVLACLHTHVCVCVCCCICVKTCICAYEFA